MILRTFLCCWNYSHPKDGSLQGMHLAFLPLQGCHPGTVGRGSVDTALAYHARHVGFQRLRYLELGIVVRTHLESRHSEGAGRPVRSSRPFSGKQNKISLSSGWWIKDLVEVGEQGGARPSQGPPHLSAQGPRSACRWSALQPKAWFRRQGAGEAPAGPSPQCLTQPNGCLPSPSLP